MVTKSILATLTATVLTAAGVGTTAGSAAASAPTASAAVPQTRSALPVREAYNRFAYESMYGSAKAACSMLSASDAKRWLERSPTDGGLIDEKNCVDGVTVWRKQVDAIHTTDCHGFTPKFLKGNLAYAQRYINAHYTSRTTARLYAKVEVDFFTDVNKAEDWTKVGGRWTITSGPPPLFSPQC